MTFFSGFAYSSAAQTTTRGQNPARQGVLCARVVIYQTNKKSEGKYRSHSRWSYDYEQRDNGTCMQLSMLIVSIISYWYKLSLLLMQLECNGPQLMLMKITGSAYKKVWAPQGYRKNAAIVTAMLLTVQLKEWCWESEHTLQTGLSLIYPWTLQSMDLAWV